MNKRGFLDGFTNDGKKEVSLLFKNTIITDCKVILRECNLKAITEIL